MIISHKHKFIFIKTVKTAGTSIEVFLSQCCGEEDVLTPIMPPVEPHVARNHRGFWNPIPQMLACGGWFGVLKRLAKRKKFFNHMPAKAVRATIPASIWNGYYKFCVERNPWDKVLSGYYMDRAKRNRSLAEFLRKGRLPVNYPMYADEHGRPLVDEVIRYESLMEGLARVFGKLGIPFNGSLGVNAKSEYRKDRRPYREVFTAGEKELVARAFAREIEMHGYEF